MRSLLNKKKARRSAKVLIMGYFGGDNEILSIDLFRKMCEKATEVITKEFGISLCSVEWRCIGYPWACSIPMYLYYQKRIGKGMKIYMDGDVKVNSQTGSLSIGDVQVWNLHKKFNDMMVITRFASIDKPTIDSSLSWLSQAVKNDDIHKTNSPIDAYKKMISKCDYVIRFFDPLNDGCVEPNAVFSHKARELGRDVFFNFAKKKIKHAKQVDIRKLSIN